MGYYGGTQALGYTGSSLFIGLLADYVSYPAAFLYGGAMCAFTRAASGGAPNRPGNGRRRCTPLPAVGCAASLTAWPIPASGES